MFESIPENYRAHTADDEEEGWRYCQGHKDARRPPELLTRDHVSRCIVREIRRAGEFRMAACSSISHGSNKKCRTPPNTLSESASMYHQFKHCRHRLLQSKRWKSSNHSLHHGRRPCSSRYANEPIAGTICSGECAAGINGANPSVAIRCRSFWFLETAGESLTKFAKEHQHATSTTTSRHRWREALARSRQRW